jgi:hypothetical protein
VVFITELCCELFMDSASAEGGESEAVEALLRFDSKAAALVLEEEVREAFFGSISSAIGPHLFTAALHQHPAHALQKRVKSWQRGSEDCHWKAVARELLPGRGKLPEQSLSTSADGVMKMLAAISSPQGGKQQHHECGPVDAGAGSCPARWRIFWPSCWQGWPVTWLC